jgi:uncharacterized protein (DUF302 family)
MNEKMGSSEKIVDAFTYKIESNQSIVNIAQKVPETCEKYKVSLLQTYVYHEIVESKGFPIKRKAYVFEICQAKIAAAMLTDYPHFSIFMPCRIAIYEENELVVISTMNMGLLLNEVRSNSVLYKNTTTLFETVKTLMKSIANN